MSEPELQNDSSLHDTGAPSGMASALVRVSRFFGALRAWTYGHWVRGLIVAGTILSLIGFTLAGWAYLANMALRSGELDLNGALQALDEGRYESARAAVGKMLKGGRMPRSEFGGPLYVLGAVKTKDAENQATAERRRIEYLVASRYLKEARAYDMPAEREADGLFLLGKSLVESGQFDDGLTVLDELIAGKLPADHPLAWQSQQLIADTCLIMPQPNAAKALAHNTILSSMRDLTEAEQAGVLLQRAECLSRLDRFEEAQRVVAAIPAPRSAHADVELMRGKISLDELGATFERIAPSERSKAIVDAAPQIAEAMQHLQKAQELDAHNTQVSRQSSYQKARGLELQGKRDEALKQFAKTRQQFGESFEGLAASLAEADMLREKGDFEAAVLGYRRVLKSFNTIPVYHSLVLPVAQVRERMMSALKDFIDRQRFADALTLLDHFEPLFTRAEQLELRGGTLERWGTMLVEKAPHHSHESNKYRMTGLHHLRAAGVAFQQLAELRFATKFYTTDLWHAAECFFQGHNFTRTAELLNDYLANEPELRNAETLLRLGQAHLALQKYPEAISAFDECIELHPKNSASYQARIDCAKACWHQGNTSRAEILLRENIGGSALTPTSREWKDSLFELGMLLFETGQYEQAIGKLEEAILRYPHDPQRLVAQYLVGEAHRRWAQELLDRAQQSRTASERDKTNQQASALLNTALKNFEEVQVSITFKTHDIHSDPLLGTMLRNCYMLEGTVLFDLGRYKEAIEAYSNVASLYPDDPFVLETFVEIANCWRRLNRHDNARGAVQQAQIALDGLPANADFASTSALNREEWGLLLADMSKW